MALYSKKLHIRKENGVITSINLYDSLSDINGGDYLNLRDNNGTLLYAMAAPVGSANDSGLRIRRTDGTVQQISTTAEDGITLDIIDGIIQVWDDDNEQWVDLSEFLTLDASKITGVLSKEQINIPEVAEAMKSVPEDTLTGTGEGFITANLLKSAMDQFGGFGRSVYISNADTHIVSMAQIDKTGTYYVSGNAVQITDRPYTSHFWLFVLSLSDETFMQLVYPGNANPNPYIRTARVGIYEKWSLLFPRPQEGAGLGQLKWVSADFGEPIFLPDDGTWAYWGFAIDTLGHVSQAYWGGQVSTGVKAGGTLIDAGYPTTKLILFCWRIVE